MGFPPIDKSFEGTFKEVAARLILVERRLAIGGAGGSEVPYDALAGMVMPFAGGTVPDGWLLCDGATVSRSGYSKLFAAIGTTYGAGDGSTTFALPNYKGRVLVGQDAAQTEFDALGETGGEKTHKLTIAEMPTHSHTRSKGNDNNLGGAHGWQSIDDGSGAHATDATGGDGAHNNLQPYAVAQYIISTGEGVGGGSVTASGGSGNIVAGLISPFAGPVVPGGWLLCDGRAVARSGYPSLFSVIGVSYGAGDGSTTFNLPNLKGRVAFGLDAAQTEFDALGESGGSKAHRHDFKYGTFDRNWFAAGPSAGMNSEASSAPDDNDRMGAFRYSTGKFSGAVSSALSGNLLAINSVVGASNTNAQLGRFITTGDTDVPAGSTGLPPYVVANYIISTGTGAGGGGTDIPVQLWNELYLAATTGTVAAPGNQVVWDGAVKGNLGVTLSADKKTITFPSAGTYRVLPHIGLANSPNAAANANADINGASYAPSFSYGAPGPAGAWSYDTEFYITVNGPTTLRYAVNTASIYWWSWLRIEKQEPIFVNEATAVAGRATIGANLGTPATPTTFIVNWSTYEGHPGVWSASAPGRFVLNKPGKWRVSGKIRIQGASTGIGYMNIWKNGNSITQNEDLRVMGDGGAYPACQDIITSNGSDYIEFRATTTNASMTVQAANCLALLEWIGA